MMEGFILINQYIRIHSSLKKMDILFNKMKKAKEEAFNNTAHQFKTPLYAMIHIAQIIREDGKNLTVENDQHLAHIVSIATRLSSLVDDIIDFESLLTGSVKIEKQIIDINGPIQLAVDILGYMEKGEKVDLINRIPVGVYYVCTDVNRFKQIIFNLIGNALKYTEQGIVEIMAEVKEDWIYILVEDTGMGIERTKQKDIFKRTVSESNTVLSKDIALGLSVSKLLAEVMGGELYLKWSERGKGSVFCVKLPLSKYDNVLKQTMEQEQTIHNKRKSSSELSVSERKNKIKYNTILIVDDEVSDIMMLKEVFYEDCYEIKVAYDGETALDMIRKHEEIDIVLLDLMMPGKSGYDVCRRIRDVYQVHELPILLITVRHTSEEIEAGLAAGANDFLVKPFQFSELKSRVKTQLQLREAVKDALNMETMFLQSQIKPHFLYNTLSIIIALCYQDGERAGKLLEEFSNYLQLIFTLDPKHSFISLDKELSLANSYIEIQKARFGERLKINFQIEEELLKYKIPALTVQPIVENAIRHGLMIRYQGGTVGITATSQTEQGGNCSMKIIVYDNGVGMEKELLEKLQNNTFQFGIGLKSVNKRLMNEYGSGLQISSDVGIGTRVTIEIPIKE